MYWYMYYCDQFNCLHTGSCTVRVDCVCCMYLWVIMNSWNENSANSFGCASVALDLDRVSLVSVHHCPQNTCYMCVPPTSQLVESLIKDEDVGGYNLIWQV